MNERIARELYIATNEDGCIGAYADRYTAAQAVEDEVACVAGEWKPSMHDVDADEYAYVIEDVGVVARIERVPLERRSAGDRRGSGR